MLETKLVSSLTKIYPDAVNGNEIKKATTLKNQPFSFQVAYKIAEETTGVSSCFVRVESELDDKYISQYAVGYVPVTRAVSLKPDEFFDRKTPGVYPDPLFRRETNAQVANDGF